MMLTHLFAIVILVLYSILNALGVNLLFFVETLCNKNFGKKLKRLIGQPSTERSITLKILLRCLTEF